MLRKPLMIFLLVVGILVGAALAFIQSPQFATVVKRAGAKYIPSDFGVKADFSELSVQLIPPVLSLKNPKIVLSRHNIAGLPEGSTISADRIDLKFRLFQFFTRQIRVNEVVVVKGNIDLRIDPRSLQKKSEKKRGGLGIHWDELFHVHAEAVALEDTRLKLSFGGPGPKRADSDWSVAFLAKTLRIGQWTGKGGLGYELGADLREIDASPPRAWHLPEQKGGEAVADVRLNALGATIRELRFRTAGLSGRLEGSVKGNVLNLRSLPLDAQLELSSDLANLCGASCGTDQVAGSAKFSGQVRGDLERPLETLHAEGKVLGSGLRFEKWEAAELLAQLSWTAAPSGGEVRVEKLAVSSPEAPRGPDVPARGGKIEAGPFAYRIGSTDALSVPVTLERVALQWLAAPALKKIFGLQLRASGALHVDFSPARGQSSWSVGAKFDDLKVDDFQLDNQKLGVTKPLKKILSIPRIALSGAVTVDRSALGIQNVVLTMPRSRAVAYGRVDFRTGYDLHAGGAMNLDDVGTLAEQKIRGVGVINSYIHGPSSRVLVDFFPELKDGYFVHLSFGDVTGKITYDDGPTQVLLSGVQITKGATSYSGDGVIDLDRDTIDVSAKFDHGDVRDLSQVFSELTRRFWWYPDSLTGPFNGTARILGGIDLSKLKVLASITGANWDFYGEKLRRVSLTGGYDSGDFFIEDLHALKHDGSLIGRIRFDRNDRFDWDFRTDGLSVTDLDHVAQLDVPVRGKLLVQSSGKGPVGAIESTTTALLRDVAVRGGPLPSSSATLKTANGVATLQGTALGGQGVIDLVYDFKPGSNSYLRAALRRLDFSPLVMLINPKLIQDPALAGLVSASADLRFRTGEAEHASGRVDITDYVLAKTGTRFSLDHPVSFDVSDGTFDLGGLTLGGGQSRASLALRSDRGELDGTISGDVDLSIAEFFTSAVTQAAGAASLDFNIGGKIKDPTFFGSATISGASFRTPSLDSPFENITGTLLLKQSTLVVENLESDLANGKASASGDITLFSDRFPKVDLGLALSGNKLRVYPFQYAKVRGKLAVHGDSLPYAVDGALTIDSALSRESFFQKGGGTLKTARFMPPPESMRQGDAPKFALNIDVSADHGIFIKNEMMDAEAKAKVKVVNTLDAPRVVGSADVVQGKILFKDRIFQIQSANATFDSPVAINPRFNLTGVTDVNGTKIQMYVAGTMDKWTVDFNSTPVLSKSEILSLLAIGLSQDQIRKMRAGQGTLDQGQAIDLVLNQTGVNRDVQEKTGLEIQLDEAVTNQDAASVFRPNQTQTDTTSSPKIVIKRKVMKNVDVSLGSTVGVGTGTQREVNAEVHVTPGVSVIGVWDNLQNDNAEVQQNVTSYGLDLKFQKRFR